MSDTAVVTGTLNGVPIADSARVEFRHESGSAMHTTIDADSASLVVGSSTSTTITVTVRDAAGNRIYRSAGAVVLQSTLGQIRSLIDHQNGLYTALLKVGDRTGTAVVSGTLNGTAIVDTAAVVFRK
jgi:adhesin/invasin